MGALGLLQGARQTLEAHDNARASMHKAGAEVDTERADPRAHRQPSGRVAHVAAAAKTHLISPQCVEPMRADRPHPL